MANKFTKSVLERQQKEAREAAVQKQKSPDEPPASKEVVLPQPTAAEPAAQPKAPQKNTAKPASVLTKSKTADTQNESSDALSGLLSQVLTRENQRSAKNKTFYLDVEVIERIKMICEKEKIAESKLVNDILKKVLGI